MQPNLSITSFGHCYHALIVAKLIKTGISQRDSDINSCFNFAKNLPYYIYRSDLQGQIIGMVEFAEFVENYRNAYIIADSTLNRLRNDQYGILTRDGQFRATFMYYFFLGRYFARNQIGHRDNIAHLCEECHVGINRLILLFITHHTNDENIIVEISLQTVCTTEDVEPAILDEEEQKRFFKILASIPKSILTEDSVDSQRRKERAKRDGGEDEVEELDKGKSKTQEGDINQIYRVLKCNQILGQILRNKYGSLKKGKVEEIVEAITDGGLKLVNSV